MPEIRRGQGKPGTGPDRPDFRSRRLRRGISAQGRSARRRQRQLRFCRRSLRPPGSIGNQPRWPIYAARRRNAAPRNYQQEPIPEIIRSAAAPAELRARRPTDRFRSSAPGVAPQEDEIDLPARRRAAMRDPRGGGYRAAPSYPPRDRYPAPSSAPYAQPSYSQPPQRRLPCRGSGPRRAIPSARSGRSR